MKKKIRYGVWESNSSSTHSVSFSKIKLTNFAAPTPNEDGYLYVDFGNFGWEYRRYRDPYVKLQYLLTMVAMLYETSEEEFYELDDFKMIENAIKNKIQGCEGIRMNNGAFGTYGIDGYIDHQSCGGFSCIWDFLTYYEVSLEDFIFNSDIVLITDNDNH